MNTYTIDIIKLLSSVIANILIVVFTFQLKIRKIAAFLILVGGLLFNIVLDHYLIVLGNTFLLALQLDTLIFCIIVVLISAGNIYGQVFFHYSQNLFTNCIAVIGLYVSGINYWFGFAFTELILLLYLVSMLKFGTKVVTAVRAFLKSSFWKLLIIYPIAAYYALRLVAFELPRAMFAPRSDIMLAISLLVGIVMSILIIWLAQQKTDAELKTAESIMILATGESYYKNLTEVLERIRIIKHDYKHELAAIKHFVQNNQIQELKDFLMLPGVVDREDVLSISKNPVVNALLVHYINICKQESIQFTTMVNLPRLLPAGQGGPSPNNYELCVVIGNLLENAVEANVVLPAKERFIQLKIHCNENRIIVDIKNSMAGRAQYDENGLPISNKQKDFEPNTHGLGLKSVKTVCEHYNGLFLCSDKDGVFSASAVLNI